MPNNSSQKSLVIIDWLRDYAIRRIDSSIMDERRCLSPHVILDFGNNNLFGLLLPEEYGGLSLDYRDAVKIIEQLAAIDLTLASFIINCTQSSYLIYEHGSPFVHQRILANLARGREIASIALTESEAGSNLSGLNTKAIPNGSNCWNISGTKRWIGSAAWASVICVFAKIENSNGDNPRHALTGFAVFQDLPGVQQGPEALTLGFRGMIQNSVYLKNVLVDRSHLLGKPNEGFEVAQKALSMERLLISASCIGAMKRCAQLMHRYAKRRTIITGNLFENPISLGKFFEITTAITISETFVNTMAQWMDEKLQIPQVLFMIGKSSLSEFLWRSVDQCMQMLGARGYTESNGIAQMLRDARVYRIGGGGDTEISNMYVGSSICNSHDPLNDFLREKLSAHQPLEKVKELLEYAKDKFPKVVFLHKTPMIGWYWLYSLIGEITHKAVLLAIYQSDNAFSKKSSSYQAAEAWLQEDFTESLHQVKKKLQESPSPLTGANLEDIIVGYQKSIGNLDPRRSGIEDTVDDMLKQEKG